MAVQKMKALPSRRQLGWVLALIIGAAGVWFSARVLAHGMARECDEFAIPKTGDRDTRA
jgi:uncharacterized membrane protein YsdA (DUF1294 family)